MPILRRYILYRLCIVFLAILITLSGLALLLQSIRIFDLIIEKGIEISEFMHITLLLLPSLFQVMIPIALILAISLTLNHLRHDREIIAIKSLGLSDSQIARPIMYFALLVASINYFTSFYLMPNCYRQFRDMSMHFRNNYASLLLQEDAFSTQVNYLTIYVGRFLDNGHLRDIFINDYRDHRFEKTISANFAKLEVIDYNAKLELKNGTIQQKEIATDKLSIVHFKEYKMPIDMRINPLSNMRAFADDEKYLHELFFPMTQNKAELKRLHAHAHHRIIWPSFNISFALLISSWLIARPYNRRLNQRDSLLLFSMVSLFILLSMIFYNFARSNNYFIIMMYLNFLTSLIMPFTWFKTDKYGYSKF